MKITTYSSEIEGQMLNFYNSLSEKDRRRYAAIETTKLGYGGATYIRQILHCNDRTIVRGQQELQTEISQQERRIRLSSAGRKSVLSTTEGLSEAFLEVLTHHTAGSRWMKRLNGLTCLVLLLQKSLKSKGLKSV